MTPESIGYFRDILTSLFPVVSMIGTMTILVSCLLGLTALAFWSIINEIKRR